MELCGLMPTLVYAHPALVSFVMPALGPLFDAGCIWQGLDELPYVHPGGSEFEVFSEIVKQNARARSSDWYNEIWVKRLPNERSGLVGGSSGGRAAREDGCHFVVNGARSCHW